MPIFNIIYKLIYRFWFYITSFYLMGMKKEINRLIHMLYEDMSYIIEHSTHYDEQKRILLNFLSEMNIVFPQYYSERYELHYKSSPNNSLVMYRPYKNLSLEYYFYVADSNNNHYSLSIDFLKNNKKAIYQENNSFSFLLNKNQLSLYLKELTTLTHLLKQSHTYIDNFSYLENHFEYKENLYFPLSHDVIEKYYSMIDSEQSNQIFLTYMAYLKNSIHHKDCACYLNKINEIRKDIEKSYYDSLDILLDVNYKPSPYTKLKWPHMMEKKLALLDNIDLFILKQNLIDSLDEQEEVYKPKI